MGEAHRLLGRGSGEDSGGQPPPPPPQAEGASAGETPRGVAGKSLQTGKESCVLGSRGLSSLRRHQAPWDRLAHQHCYVTKVSWEDALLEGGVAPRSTSGHSGPEQDMPESLPMTAAPSTSAGSKIFVLLLG